MKVLANVPVGINGKIQRADIEARGTVSERALWILERFKELPVELQEKMLLNLETLRKKKMPILQISTTYKKKLINYTIKKGKMQCEKFRTYRKADRDVKEEV